MKQSSILHIVVLGLLYCVLCNAWTCQYGKQLRRGGQSSIRSSQPCQGQQTHHRIDTMARFDLHMNKIDEISTPVRVDHSPRSALSQISKVTRFGALVASALLVSSMGKPESAWAQSSLEAANSKLSGYGFPPVLFVPPGFSVIASEYGRGGLREKMTVPVLVQFAYPSLWVVATTSVNNNGEAGTISAGDYVKGDSAFFHTSMLNNGETLSVNNQDLIKKHIIKSFSQKGSDLLDNVAIQSVALGASDVTGQEYITVTFSYDLNTEAGFLISRRGVMSVTSVGNALQSIAAVTTKKRYKELSQTLSDIAKSFRVYRLNSGIFSADGAAPKAA